MTINDKVNFLDETQEFLKQYGISEDDIAYCRVVTKDGEYKNITFNSFKMVAKRFFGDYGSFRANDYRIVFKNGDFAERDSYNIDWLPNYKKTINHWKYICAPLLDVEFSNVCASELVV